jgi:hypothetical protein
MRVSHRDHRVDREIYRSAGGMAAMVVVLGGIALYAPLDAFRYGALLGLGVSGGFFLWRTGLTVGDYVGDLERVQSGEERSGRIRVEVESDVGFERMTVSPLRRSPLVRHPPYAVPPPDEDDLDDVE